MAKTFRCRLITPTAQVLDEPVSYASIPAWDGLFGVLPNRAPIVAKLGTGELRLDFGGEKGGSRSFLVQDGFVQMISNKLTILATLALPVETLSEPEAKAELAEAEARQAGTGPDREKVRKDRERARTKVRLARKSAGRGI
ncbi:MAG: F0F1 ATP synthase subunit epsilon [Phycisphaerales bacterium]